ncbi:MAG: maleylacetoacetate isomerase [Myxococcales bacterium]|nr:maleylacetoacetate isomerase [Myxococcales bacterium]
MKLWGYWRSSASYRVRIGLNLKGLAYEQVAVHLVKDGGVQHSAEHKARNPMEQVPVLELSAQEAGADRPIQLTQSVAILEYLDERFPDPPLLPADAHLRARIRKCVEIVNSGIQPLQNLTLMNELKRLGGDPIAFAKHANERGLAALETEARDAGGKFTIGDALSLADVFLVPQIYSAKRFKVDLSAYPFIAGVASRLEELPAFASAHPDKQPDAEPT